MASPDTFSPNKKVLVKVVVLGDAGVGKTSLLQRYVIKEFSDSYKTTIGADFLSMDVSVTDAQTVSLQLWDTAGQERFQGLGNAFFRGANACVLVYDITNEKSFLGLKAWYDAFVNQSNCLNPSNFPFVLVGNKLDQAVNRTVAKRRAATWAEENGCLRYFEASAKDSTGVDEIFIEVAKVVAAGMESGEDALRKYQKETSTIKSLVTDTRAKEKEEDNVCC